MKISVIMASYLGEYPGCASDRVYKFKRAVDSFILQSYNNKELIIVSDGCNITENLYNDLYKKNDNILFTKIEKEATFSGKTRNVGIDISTGDYICYLDSDDFLSKIHLENISKQVTNHEWYYYDDRIVTKYNNIDDFESTLRVNLPEINRIGTSTIVHRKNNIKWTSGYAHDWIFIKNQIDNNNNYKKIDTDTYNVCHIPNMIDL
jgi:glycosyltransferase involved in cell wall biosynthesis